MLPPLSPAWAQGAAAEKRVAPVIGNAACKDAPLRNPVNDARLMAAKLKQPGFEVGAGENASRAQMASAVGCALGPACVGWKQKGQ
ncbi:MAG: caspase family protein [Alphaproteobacteria bacterium]|nr:caspase family protein [Alphaproteobacteria bacterium]